jgi:hypothetical protein
LAVGCTSDLYDRSMTFKLNKVSWEKKRLTKNHYLY